MFSFAGNAQEAGAGCRSGAAGIPVRGSLMGSVRDSVDATGHECMRQALSIPKSLRNKKEFH